LAWYKTINVINPLINEDYSTEIHPHGATALSKPGSPHYRGFTITLRHAIPGRITLDKGSARSTDLFITIHNTQNRLDVHGSVHHSKNYLEITNKM
jgi:hypothetical protein